VLKDNNYPCPAKEIDEIKRIGLFLQILLNRSLQQSMLPPRRKIKSNEKTLK